MASLLIFVRRLTAVLSLLFSYVPGLAEWYGRLGERTDDEGNKLDDGGTLRRLVMLALLALVSLAVLV